MNYCCFYYMIFNINKYISTIDNFDKICILKVIKFVLVTQMLVYSELVNK